MSVGTPYVTNATSHAQGNTIAQLTTAQLTTVYGSSVVFTPNSNFGYTYKSQTLHFTKNVSQTVDAGLKTTLVTAGLGS